MSVIPQNPAVEPYFSCATYILGQPATCILGQPKIPIRSPLSFSLLGVSYPIIMSHKSLSINNNSSDDSVTVD